ncbi:MAG: glycosyltransferase family 2 protein [Pseudomonadota bacterium]
MNTSAFKQRREQPTLSIVTPFYNEEASSQRFFQEVFAATDHLETTLELICVDDGSQDNTLQKLLSAAREEPRIKVLALSRNFGKESALTAGIEAATGDVVVIIDADLQDPPELIGEMLEKWREGHDVVYGVRQSRGEDSWMKRITAGGFYTIFNSLTSVPVPANTGDFRLLDRRVADRLREMPERTRFAKGMFAWLGFKSTAVYYDRPKREQGQTSWSYWKLWNFALDGVTSFSTVPLRVWTYIGLAVSVLSFAYASFLVLRTLIMGVDLPGYASLMVVILFLGGIQLISLGVLGEYIGRVFIEVKQRPIYLVDRVYHFPADGTEPQQ